MEDNLLTEVTVHQLKQTRWFRNNVMDLIVELNDIGEFTHFSMSFRERAASLSLEWDGYHLRTFEIDEGEQAPLRNNTPIVTKERMRPPKKALGLLEKFGSHLEASILDFVSSRLISEI